MQNTCAAGRISPARTSEFAEGGGECRCLWIQLAHKLLAVLRNDLCVLGGGARRKACLANACQLLTQTLRYLQLNREASYPVGMQM